jgi:hypothetical protein
MSATPIQHPASYRDPSGFIFIQEGIVYRQVNLVYKEHYDHFMTSGCYEHMATKGWIVTHQETDVPAKGNNYYKILMPEKIPVISYPNEWTFDMLRDAALLTLRLTREALKFDMILKDATPLNVQWHKGRFVFIDTLSFEKYNEHPWIAYRQFCETFLGPLLLMHYNKTHLPQLFLGWPDGIPVQLLRSLLPQRSRFSLAVYLHIHLNAKYAARKNIDAGNVPSFSRQKLFNLVSNLESLIQDLKSPRQTTDWSHYYQEVAGRNDYLSQKKNIISEWLEKMTPIKIAADLGANEGEFSSMLASKNIQVLAADFDAQSINGLYEKIKKTGEKNIHPFVIDLSNPTPATGVGNTERASFSQRCKADLVMALALIHHLVIGKNIPFLNVAHFLASLTEYLVIEFVPKEDEKVKIMLSQKKDIYPDYKETSFLEAFNTYFAVVERKPIPGTSRILFLFRKNRE